MIKIIMQLDGLSAEREEDFQLSMCWVKFVISGKISQILNTLMTKILDWVTYTLPKYDIPRY